LGWNWKDKNNKNTARGAQVDFSKPTSGGPADQGFHHYYGDDVPNWPPYVWIDDHTTVGIPSVPKPKSMFGSPGLMLPGWTLEPVLPEITRRSADYIREQAKNEKPFFLFFPMTSPHTPIAPAKEFQGKSGISPYADFLIQTDWCVGQILKAVDDAGISDNTIVFFTTDNGTSPKAKFTELEAKGVHLRHSFRGNKADIYEGGHRVPFIVRWPKNIAAGGRSNETICTVDFMSTVADVIGHPLSASSAEDSFSLLPILRGKETTIADRKAVINHSISGNFAIRKGPWKLVFARGSAGWSDPKEAVAAKKKMPALQLFNLDDDPKEQKNIQAQHPELVTELTQLLKTTVTDGRSTPGPKQANHGTWWPQLPWPQRAVGSDQRAVGSDKKSP
jgi:arylsulfatase A-like enzyme